jgi:ribose 5-phosphate isomerase A
MTENTPQDRAKIAAGRRAVEVYCTDGLRLGLGSGTTSHLFVRALAERVRDGLDIVGVPTSDATRDLAMELGVPLVDLDDVGELDITLDGFDEMDPEGRMIKGGGGAHLREKIVARAAKKMVGLGDESKLVPQLGRFPLPVEVVRFGHVSTTRLLQELFADHGYADLELTPRMAAGERFVTDSGNYLLDAHLGRITGAEELTVALNQIPGVVENGLFLGIAREVVIGHPDGSTEVRSLA